jgi:FAD binding domain/Berberine and berberine like
MPELNRRQLLAAAPVVLGGALAAGRATAGPAGTGPAADPAIVRPDDSRYAELVVGNNQRWTARPDYVVVATESDHVLRAVQDAVTTGRRVTVRSGGHCYEDFVYNADTKIVIDLSEMDLVTFDADRNAFAVQPGATLWQVYETLFRRWGVTLPGGSCPSVGVGGHIAGGGYGVLSRSRGLTVDHLYGVEVVVVGADGVARLVRATREAGDPNRDLWWAHTGGGGGNFGVVTRYWLRSPDVTGTDPTALLPRAPAEVLVNTTVLPWATVTGDSFVRLVRNFGEWHEANSAPDSPTSALSAILALNNRSAGAIALLTQVNSDEPSGETLLTGFLDAVLDGIEVPAGDVAAPRRLPWLHAVYQTGTSTAVLNDPTLRADHKSAYFRRTPTDAQSMAMYDHLVRADFANPDAGIVLFSFGAQINATAPDATAVPQRGSILKFLAQSFWQSPTDDDANIAWLRAAYGDIFATTGGVPVPNDLTDGCYVNYPDTDLSDPAWNRSDTPWSTLYYQGNYPRLQQVKSRWDPRDIFRHAQSIAPAG